jgi:NAD(P)H-dependent flavin oxidoreductase YrpB (nitropropane dioxygenase family)
MREQIETEKTFEYTDIDIIQGGMGVGVSNWKLAGAVAAEGAMGVVSGTVIGPVLARRLQNGDQDGSSRQALSAFPDQSIAENIVQKYYQPRGRKPNQPYKTVPKYDAKGRKLALELNLAGAFTEVWLAKKLAARKSDRPGPIGMNLLTKLQAPTLTALYGAILAKVDCIIMGAGIPYEIPKSIDDLVHGNKASIHLDVIKAEQPHEIEFDPTKYPLLDKAQKITPAFFAIISSNILAKRMSQRKLPPSGFVVEGPVAGGHNAPPRDKIKLEYDDRDRVNLKDMVNIGLPFWVAGGYDSPEKLKEAKDSGANGIQVGSAFLVCQDSGLDPLIRDQVINKAINEGIEVSTEMRASPTGFPFKVVQLPGTLSEEKVYYERERNCDLGFLREAYVVVDKAGKEVIYYRCTAELEKDFIKKGGSLADTIGKICLCNGLMATIGLGQTRHGVEEKPIVTAGDILTDVTRQLVAIYGLHFSAKEVLNYLRSNNR